MILQPEVLIPLSSAGAFLLQFAGIIWRISKAESRIERQINEVEREADSKINKLKTELLEARLDAANRYVNKEAFNTVMTNIDSRLIRFEAKLDQTMHSIRTKSDSKD
jgi:hypothetical protein